MTIPKLSAAHVTIDEFTLSKALATGHPRLLKDVLTNDLRGALRDVIIEHISVNGELKIISHPKEPTE